jgi:hypothetical protein
MAGFPKYRIEVKHGRHDTFTDVIVARRDTYPGDPDGYEAVIRIEDGTVTCNAQLDNPELTEAVLRALNFANAMAGTEGAA